VSKRISLLLLLAGIAALATGAVVASASSAPSGERISGGSGDRAWHIQYGTNGSGVRVAPGRLPGPGVLSLSGPGEIAFFTHDNWLRRIDVDKGMVTGRWHFPGVRITALTWKGDHIQVQVDDYRFAGESFSRTIDFNPGNPQIPSWPTGSIAPASAADLSTGRATAGRRRPWAGSKPARSRPRTARTASRRPRRRCGS